MSRGLLSHVSTRQRREDRFPCALGSSAFPQTSWERTPVPIFGASAFNIVRHAVFCFSSVQVYSGITLWLYLHSPKTDKEKHVFQCLSATGFFSSLQCLSCLSSLTGSPRWLYTERSSRAFYLVLRQTCILPTPSPSL